MAIDIVDLAINSIVISHSYGNVYQKVITVFSSSLWGIPQQTVNHTFSRKCGCVQVCPIEKDPLVFGCTCSCLHFRVTMSPSISLTCTIWQTRPHVSMPFNPQTKLMSQLSNPLPGICRFSLVMGSPDLSSWQGSTHDEGFNGFRLCDNASDESWCHHVLWSFDIWSYLIMFVHPAASGSPKKTYSTYVVTIVSSIAGESARGRLDRLSRGRSGQTRPSAGHAGHAATASTGSSMKGAGSKRKIGDTRWCPQL